MRAKRWLIFWNGAMFGPFSEDYVLREFSVGCYESALVKSESDAELFTWEPAIRHAIFSRAFQGKKTVNQNSKIFAAAGFVAVISLYMYHVELLQSLGFQHVTSSAVDPGYLPTPQPLATQPAKPKFNPLEVAYDAGVFYARKKLKAPSTAKFSPIEETTVTDLGMSCTYRVLGWVDAQNEFGAMLRSSFKSVVRCTSPDNWIEVSSTIID